MSGSQKLLVMGGLLLALWGMSYGLYYAVFVEHQTLDQIGFSLTDAFAQAAQRNMPESRASLEAYAERTAAYVRQVDCHGHWIGLAMLLMVLGAAFDRTGFEEGTRVRLAAALLLGSVVFPAGVLLETVSAGPLPKALAAAGAGLVVIGLAGAVLGFRRAAGDISGDR